jgi:hypothetical protein
MKRDVQGKFALKNSDYRLVRSVRLTDSIKQALGIASECLGLTRADYLEQMVRDKALPSNTWQGTESYPCITRQELENQPSITRYEEQIERLNAEIRLAEPRECCVDGTSNNCVPSGSGA